MASDINEITVNYKEDDIQIVKEIDKKILSKGAWTTIIFRYQQWEKAKEKFGPDRYTIRRYRKVNNQYIQQSKFNISNNDQAQKIIDALKDWIKE